MSQRRANTNQFMHEGFDQSTYGSLRSAAVDFGINARHEMLRPAIYQAGSLFPGDVAQSNRPVSWNSPIHGCSNASLVPITMPMPMPFHFSNPPLHSPGLSRGTDALTIQHIQSPDATAYRQGFSYGTAHWNARKLQQPPMTHNVATLPKTIASIPPETVQSANIRKEAQPPQRDVLVQTMDSTKAKIPAKFDATTIALDVLMACGQHPTRLGLNAHLLPLRDNIKGVGSKSDLATFRWDVLEKRAKVAARNRERYRASLKHKSNDDSGPSSKRAKMDLSETEQVKSTSTHIHSQNNSSGQLQSTVMPNEKGRPQGPISQPAITPDQPELTAVAAGKEVVETDAEREQRLQRAEELFRQLLHQSQQHDLRVSESLNK